MLQLLLSLVLIGLFSQSVDAEDIQVSEVFGGPHGQEFSDKDSVQFGQNVASITIFSGARVHGLSLEVIGPGATVFNHGYVEGVGNKLVLKAGERIISMEAHWGKKSGRTRVFYVNFITSDGNTVAGGSMSDDKNTVKAPEGFQLGGFLGRSGDEIDQLGAVWVRSEPPPPAPPVPATEENPPDILSGDSSGSAQPPPAPPATSSISIKDAIQMSESFGGPHGTRFNDKSKVTSGQTVASLTLYSGDRVDGLELEISAPQPITFSHGYTGGGNVQKLQLGPGEYITKMEAHWSKHKGKTRIFHLSFSTNAGNTVSGGSQTHDKGTVDAPEGFQLVGFHGQDGHALDRLGAIWSSIELITLPPVTEPPSAASDMSDSNSASKDLAGPVGGKLRKRATLLSDSFGGPHGQQFSDLPLAKSAQKIATLTIRSGARAHGISLVVTDPIPETFSHGGYGGTENTLTLGPDEYITYMEAHWDKKKGTTRIFFLKFNTNKGNSVSGGSQTPYTGSTTAPEGYQLGGFFGRDGDEIDLLGVVWTSIEAVAELPKMAGGGPAADNDIKLGKPYGGPHGVAFSDVKDIILNQTMTGIEMRHGERLDFVGLKLNNPAPQFWHHGGSGGQLVTLDLAPDEHIISLEVHWGKKKGRTQVFYARFATNKDKSVEAGQKTNSYIVETAPEGYRLGGLHGRAEGEVNEMGAIWIKIDAKQLFLTDIVGNEWYGGTIRNWVGPTIGTPKDTACYRKYKPFDSKRDCPLGYSNDDDDCIAQCPMAYPVRCALECIPQNDDCALAILTKIAAVASVAFNAATAGVFVSVKNLYTGAKRIYMCAAEVINVIRQLIYYIRYTQTTVPQGEIEQLLTLSYQSNVVLTDLPIAIYTCLGIKPPKTLVWSGFVVIAVQTIVKQVIVYGEEIIASAKNVIDLIQNSTSVENSMSSVTELDDFITANTSCGYELKKLTDRVIFTVSDIRNKTPNAAIDDVRVTVSKSSMVFNDVPRITNNCMKEMLKTKTKQAAFETRDLLRKTMEVIIDQLVDTGTTDMGKDVAEEQQLLESANFGLVVLGGLDPTGIVYMASQFVQPICGPSGFIGDIDDGNLYDALGMMTVDEAFVGSYGTWTKVGDGVVRIIFESTDREDVTVVIHSGGNDYADVDVAAGDTVTWEASVPELQDKTLYLDRWRPGLFGLPGSGGGSLLLWIPRAEEGGHLTLHARINVS